MTHIRLVAAVAATFALGAAAHAESNNLAAVETPPATRIVQGGGTAADRGSDAYPAFIAPRSVPIVAGTDLLLPGNGDVPVQTAASLPRGFSVGTVAYAQARSMARYLAEREALRFAQRTAPGRQPG